jgi:predicted O-methyltransferase YrrM
VTTDLATTFAEIIRIAPGLHKAGTFSTVTLEAIRRHATAAPVAASAETGSGASTLLLSHISKAHTVFAMDLDTGSVRQVEASPLLKPGVVTFVEGPTQQTLPRHQFAGMLDLVLIDGPHGYPFPDLEYYFFYPHLRAGSLLIIDDIHIPTITNLFDVIRSDDMFTLEDVVETTAFLRRTSAPTFSPTGDGWWLQNYNKRAFEQVPAQHLATPDAVPIDGSAVFYIDKFGAAVNPAEGDTLRLAAADEVIVSGWALDQPRQQAASAVDFVIDGRIYRAAIRVPRGDVAHAYGSHNYFRCGFTATFPAGALRVGSQDVEVRVLVDGGRSYLRSRRFQVVMA